MSDTPRTDAASRMAFSGEYMVEIDEAQKLERDLAQSKEANAGLMLACDKLERELTEAKETIAMLEIRHGATMLCHQAQMDEITKQRDHYKKACDQYSEDEMLCKLAEVTKQRDALAEALPLAMARAYERGYQCGHEDTVESRFVIVHANDAIDYFADDVRQMLLDGSQPEAQKALAAMKGGSDE
jgi:hypothetical protein